MRAVQCGRCGEEWPQGDPALRVACPSCQAPPGRRCRRPSAHECDVHAARDRLVITTPYYVPDASLDTAIRTAARRGVDVTMILPARNDSLVVQATSEGFYYGLVSAGVKLMLFHGGLLHSKIITVDGRMAMIGSANMDRRSFELNYEMNMLFVGDDLTAVLDARQMTYIERAESITIGEIRAWSVWRRLRNNLLALAAPIL